ncbi:M50 family metallopeptidase [Arthrobacter sp. BF1]|uniref:M50 family metallopeptidase n=1 Tax=Arthrobacter sp. BF1 TaxID=2821145 RepID=UPI00211A4CA1|nr:M50 family metallopeptidase [Arthrobacter sp. BF1]
MLQPPRGGPGRIFARQPDSCAASFIVYSAGMTNAAGELGNTAANWWAAIANGFTRTDPLSVPLGILLAIIGAAVVLSIPRVTWRWFGLYVTFVHELGHAFAALMTGRVVHGLKIGLDHSGQLVSSGRRGFSATWSGFWGYPAPAIVGLALVWSVSAGWAGAAASIGALILLLALIFLRNFTGIVVALLSAAVAQALVMFATPQTVSWAILTLGIALAVGSVRDFFKVAAVHTRRRNQLTSSDAYLLAQSTGVPSVLWLAGFALVIGASGASSAYFVWGMLAR